MRYAEPRHPGSLLPLWDIVGQDVVTTQGVILRGMELFGLDSEHEPGNRLLAAAECLYEQFACRLPEGSHLQFWLESARDDEGLAAARAATPAPDDETLALQQRRRFEHLESLEPRRHRVYLFAGSLAGMSPAEFRRVSRAAHRRRARESEKVAAAARAALEAAGVQVRDLDAGRLEELFWRTLNPTLAGDELRAEISRLPPARPGRRGPPGMRERLMQTPIGAYHRDFLKIGRRHAHVLTLRDLPAETAFTLTEVFYELDFDFHLSVAVSIPGQSGHRAALDRQRRLAAADAGRGGNIEDYQRAVRRAEGEELAQLLAESGQRLVLLVAQAVVEAEDLETLERRTERFQEACRRKGLVFFSESHAHDREFFKTLPGMAVGSTRELLLTSNNAVDLLPVFQERQGDRVPALLLRTARGELFSFDPFAACRDNWNATVFGASGSGKSVFVNLLISTAVLASRSAGRLLVVDFAGERKSSYLMVARLFGGRYVPVLGEDGRGSLNPFPTAARALDASGQLRPQVQTFLTVLTDLLLANVGADKDTQLFRRVLQRAFRDTYARLGGSTPMYSDVYETLESYRGLREVDQARLQVVLDLMDGFLSGPAARLFNRREGVDERAGDARFLILDLFGIDSLEPHVAQAVTYLATEWVKQLAFDPRDPGRKYVVLDEVAQLIRRPEMAGLVDELYSTARKHRTSVWTVTQSYSTYRNSALAGTVKLNSTTQIFLSHASDAQGRRQVAEDYQFNDRERVLFERLRTVKGRYSQALIRTESEDQGGGKRPLTAVLNIELSPLDYQICTSDAADRELQRRYLEANPQVPLWRVLEHIAAARGRAAVDDMQTRDDQGRARIVPLVTRGEAKRRAHA